MSQLQIVKVTMKSCSEKIPPDQEKISGLGSELTLHWGQAKAATLGRWVQLTLLVK